MRVKLGLVTAAIVPLLVFAAPASAQTGVTTTELPGDDDTSTTTAPTPSDESSGGDGTSTSTTSATTTTTTTTTSTTAPPSSTTTTTTTTGGVAGPAVVAPGGDRLTIGDAPVEVGGDLTPVRGTQKQVVPPPPPPTTLPPWDPFRIPANSGSGRRAVYSKSQQTVWAFDANNRLIKQHRVSGKQTPLDPRPGIYRVWSRSRYTFSINNPSITWGYMVRFAKGAQGGNIGFHEIPFQYGRPVQSIAQLGQPLSGGCVRQALPDAQWMWNWAQLGTLVVVTP